MALAKPAARRRQITNRHAPNALEAKGIIIQAIKPKIIALTKHHAGVHNVVGIKRRFYGFKRAALHRNDIGFKILRFQAANPMFSANRATKLPCGIVYHHTNAFKPRLVLRSKMRLS